MTSPSCELKDDTLQITSNCPSKCVCTCLYKNQMRSIFFDGRFYYCAEILAWQEDGHLAWIRDKYCSSIRRYVEYWYAPTRTTTIGFVWKEKYEAIKFDPMRLCRCAYQWTWTAVYYALTTRKPHARAQTSFRPLVSRQAQPPVAAQSRTRCFAYASCIYIIAPLLAAGFLKAIFSLSLSPSLFRLYISCIYYIYKYYR